MTNVIKCNACNIVIDELLAYIQNKISVIDEISLVRICTTAFTSDEIQKSKSLLFDAVPTDQRKIQRKRKGKEVRDLDDIINLFKSSEPENIPVFVARQLEKLPPITFDHLDCTKLLKDLTRLQAEIEEVKATYTPLIQHEELRSEVQNMKYASLPPSPPCYINARRGGSAWGTESGPMGLSNYIESSLKRIDTSKNQMPERHPSEVNSENSVNDKSNIFSERGYRNVVISNSELGAAALSAMTHTDRSPPPRSPAPLPPHPAPLPSAQVNRNQLSRKSLDTLSVPIVPIQKTKHSMSSDDEGWKIVSNRKHKPNYRYSGKRGVACDLEGKFKAAERKIPMFITNVHKDTQVCDITDYIKAKTKETVILEKIDINQRRNHSAYKFLVSEKKISIFLDENLWPEGIIFRRFVHFRNKQTDSKGSSDDRLLKSNNG